MRQIIFHGLALTLGIVMVTTASGQYGQNTWNQTQDSYEGGYRSVSSPLRNRYSYQDQDSPSDLGSAPGEVQQPAPVPGSQIQPGAPCDSSIGPINGPIGGCATGDCGENLGVYNPGPTSVLPRLGGSDSNWVAGVYGLAFARDYEDDRGLSYNGAGDYLFSTDADHDFFGGIEFMLGKRNCNGKGWEFRYWGLFPTQSDVTILNGMTNVNGLNWVTDPTSGFTVDQIYNNSTDHRIYRNSQFHNAELSLLGNAGCRGNRSYEWLAGFRWLEFDENFRYRTSTNVGAYPPIYDYELDVSNTLLGFQMGGRKEIRWGKNFRVHLAGKAGLFNNYVRHRQFMQNNTGVFGQINSGPNAGNDYNYMSTKNDIAMMGELDLGFSYQFKRCWRLRGGYRAIGLSGVALAVDQIPYNFRDGQEINRINSNGSLILHGFYAGAEFCF